MRIRDWDEQGLEPAFGHEGHWMMEMLESLDAGEIAAYCLRAPHGRRLLVATQLGLVDATADDSTPEPAVEVDVVAWPEVREIHLSAVIAPDEAMRHRPAYSLRVGHPTIDVPEAANADALLDFARSLVLRAARPPQVPLRQPED